MLNKINIGSGERKLIAYIMLSVTTLVVFLQVSQFDFVFDDVAYVTGNVHVQSGITLAGLQWAFSTIYAEFWHPLTWLSLMLDNHLFGLNASGYHMTNLILHILSTLLLFWLFNRMTGALWKSAFVAAFFALHPMHVESIAWIAERKDVLSAFFWMLTLCLYVYYTENPNIGRYCLVLLSFACGLMSKSMVVTLPLIMILLDYWPLGRFEAKKDNFLLWQLKEKILFFILSIIFSIITILSQPNSTEKGFSLASRLANAVVSFIIYLKKTFWPSDMVVFYPFPEQIPFLQVSGALFLIIIISSSVIIIRKNSPYLLVGWLWYAITIMPVIGIIQIGYFAMADRFHYLPSIGLAVMLAWGIPALMKNKRTKQKVLLPMSLGFLSIMALLAWQQCSHWENNITLFRHALRVSKDNPLAHSNLGLALFNQGKIDESIKHYNEAIRLKPKYSIPYFNRGTAYAKLSQYHLAIGDFSMAIGLEQNNADYYNSRGGTYVKLGQYHLAMNDFNKAISLKHDHANAYNNRAFCYFNQGKNDSGCYDAKSACKLGICKTLEAARSKGYCR